MSELPVGTVTFVFSDIQGSTQLIQRLGPRYGEVLLAHNQAMRTAMTGAGGSELRTEGDSFFFVFSSALDAARGAAAAQRALAATAWPDGTSVRVRIGLHTGEAALLGREYVGLDVHRAARIAAVAHGGQVLLSETTNALVDGSLPSELHLRDLGRHRLKDLTRAERLFQLDVDGLPMDFPALRTLEATPNNLPTQLTSFIGRTAELAEGKRLLERARLLTLTGPGGTGKTRLSLQLAAESADRFPDGVYFVALAAVRDPTLVSSAIAQALTVTASARPPQDAVVEFLQNKRLLLVLDNFEQLVDAAPQVSDLLERAPGLKVIVTSRAVLRVSGEQEDPVPPLRLPDLKALPDLAALSQYEAVQLFIERAVAVKPDFQVTNETAPSVAGICERLDGLPLAIELAAARIKLFSPSALLLRLDRGLSLLTTGGRERTERQQTLRGAIAWSADLLDEGERRLFARFAVFARGADLEQAERVCGPETEIGTTVLDGLDQLADQSLLRRLPEFDEPRFLMLQVIREFGVEQLEATGEAETIRERHARAYLHLAVAAEPHFEDLEKEWLDRLERDHDNIRTALDWWMAKGDAQDAMALASSLWRFWQMRGHLHEARARIAAILAMPHSSDDPVARKRLLEAAGGLAYWQADLAPAGVYYDQALEISRRLGDPRDLANALYNAAFPPLVVPTTVGIAKPLLDEAIAIFRRLDDRPGIARVLWATGIYHAARHEYDLAIASLDQARDMFRALDRRFDLGWALRLLGMAYIGKKNARLARTAASEAMSLFQDAHDVSGMVLLLSDFAAIASLEGDPPHAIALDEAASIQQITTGALLGVLASTHVEWPELPPADPESAAAYRARGRAMSLEAAVAYALEPARAVTEKSEVS